MRERALLCFALANLVIIPSWLDIYRFQAAAPDEMRSPAALALLGSATFNVVMLTGLACFGSWIVRRSGSLALQKGACLAFIAVSITALDWLSWLAVSSGLRAGFPSRLVLLPWVLLIISLLLGAIFFAFESNRLLLVVLKFVLLMMAPLGLICLASVLWAVARAPSWPPPRTAAVRKPTVPKHRVLWVVFDEWDQRLTFDVRPLNVQLPALDFLVQHSFHGLRTVSPSWETPDSFASLFIGHRVLKARWESGRTEIRLGDGRLTSFKEAGTVFGVAREMNVNAGLMGWFLPYCDEFRATVVDCWQPLLGDLGTESTLGVIRRQWYGQFQKHWLQVWFDPKTFHLRRPEGTAFFENRNQLVEAHIRFLAVATRMAADPSLGLVFIHWPLPHPPGIWDRNSDSVSAVAESNYLDNLELVDQAVAAIQRALESSGLTARTTLLLTSDHPLRPDVWSKNLDYWTLEETQLSQNSRHPHIPFILKLPNDEEEYAYADPFNSVITRRLILDTLRGRLTSHRSVAFWVDQSRGVE